MFATKPHVAGNGNRVGGRIRDDVGAVVGFGIGEEVPWRWSTKKPKIRSKNKGRREEVLAELELLALEGGTLGSGANSSRRGDRLSSAL